MAFRHEAKKYNTKFFTFTGLCSYAKVYEPDEYKGSEFWKINLHVDKDTAKKIRESGSMVRPHVDNEEVSGVPGTYYTFRRDLVKKIRDQEVEFNPPEIFDADGKPIMVYVKDPDTGETKAVGEKVYLGNGSKVEVTVEIYPAGSYGNGTRLRSIKVIDLIKYDPKAKEEVPAEGEREEVSEQKPETAAAKTRKTLDDDIPF